jgi:hypothetical protein
MTLIFNKQEVTWPLLPSDVPKFIQFLTERGYNPQQYDVVGLKYARVDKEVDYYHLQDEWDKYTGYDKILKKYMESTTWKQIDQREKERLKEYESANS